MSRTFKDQPWWYVSTEWEPVHYCRLRANWMYGQQNRDCNIPVEPDLKVWRAWNFQNWRKKPDRCMWEPVYPYRTRWWMPHPPAWYIDHIGNNPIRTRERMYERRALKEYRANGDVEEILLDDQHRHGASWYYW